MLCVFLGGCRFDGIYHRINESIDGISLTEEAVLSEPTSEMIKNGFESTAIALSDESSELENSELPEPETAEAVEPTRSTERRPGTVTLTVIGSEGLTESNGMN